MLPIFFSNMIQMLDTALPGNYTMRVEGTMNGGQGGNIFENETDIMFTQKRVSVFITTSKPIYNQGQMGASLRIDGRCNAWPVFWQVCYISATTSVC